MEPVPDPRLPPARLPDSAFDVGWSVIEWPSRFTAGESATVRLRVTNESGTTWPSRDPLAPSGALAVRLSYRWLRFGADSPPITSYADRVDLPLPLHPRESVDLAVQVKIPTQPDGYRLQFDLVQERAAWFESKGASRLISPVIVQ
ncbi:MAG: hypothetical protein ACRD3M_01385 [Thermoanaerobaculia bacterium]